MSPPRLYHRQCIKKVPVPDCLMTAKYANPVIDLIVVLSSSSQASGADTWYTLTVCASSTNRYWNNRLPVVAVLLSAFWHSLLTSFHRTKNHYLLHSCTNMPLLPYDPTPLPDRWTPEDSQSKIAHRHIPRAFLEYCYDYLLLTSKLQTHAPYGVDCRDSHHQHRYIHIKWPYTERSTILLGRTMS